jgi:hypothetical protein
MGWRCDESIPAREAAGVAVAIELAVMLHRQRVTERIRLRR